MASIIKTPKGYRAFVFNAGKRISAQFASKREASNWAARRETELRDEAAKSPDQKYTLNDAMNKYAEEVSPQHRGRRWEVVRIEQMINDKKLPTSKLLAALDPDDFGQWRNHRLTVVGRGTVIRELGLLSAILEQARREWRWIDKNPLRDVKKPAAPEHRSVLITRPQIKAMLREMGYRKGECKTVAQAVAVSFLIALRTGMRAGEICNLKWEHVHDDYCVLLVTKTTARNVPLSPKAKRLIVSMRGFDPVYVTGLGSESMSSMFRKYRERAGISGFTFHDSRHSAATWLARKIDVLSLCKMFGWTDPKKALIYFNPTASDIAKRL